MMSRGSIQSVFFDIDGTLVDSNDFHARAWVDTFAESGRNVTFESIRPLIGMGSDKLLAALDIGGPAHSDTAQRLTARRKAIFLERYIERVVAFPGARTLVEMCKNARLRCVVASSASPEELTPLLEIAGVAQLFDHAMKPDEIAASKPDPDVVQAALNWSETRSDNALMIGDTVYDIEAAHRAEVRCIALRCGGAGADSLAEADATFDTPLALATALGAQSFDSLLRAHASATNAL